WTQGFSYGDTSSKLTSLMQGAPNWKEIAHQLGARYLFWGNQEKQNYGQSKRPWEKECKLVASGDWGAIYDLDTPKEAAQPSPAPDPNATPTPNASLSTAETPAATGSAPAQ